MVAIGKLKAFVLGAGLSVATILLCLLASEFYLTIRYNHERDRIAAAIGKVELCTMRSESPELIYTRVPSTCDTNAHGYRDFDYSYSKEEGIFRIVIIGDSVAQGQGVRIRDAFGKVLERKLNLLPNGDKQKVEVIVLAQSGYSTSQELFLLEHEAFRYAPDVIIWSYVLNDPAHPIYQNSNGELGRYYFKPVLHTANFVSRKLFEISEGRKKVNCEAEYHALLHCVYWEQIASNIRKIADIAQKKNVPIIFLIHPIFEENGNFDNYFLAPVHAKLAAAAAAAGLPVVDLLNAYRSYSAQELTLLQEHGYDPWHPNEKGHKIVADYLFDYMPTAGYVTFPRR